MKYEHKVTKKPETSEVEITGSISVESIQDFRKQALKDLNNRADIAGFRKGHIPEKVLIDKVGETGLLEEAAELAIKEYAPEIIEKEAPDYIGRPQISITKIAPGNPVEFKIVISVMPEVKLPNYKKIAKTVADKKEEKLEATDKDVEDVIENMRKQHAHNAYHAAHADDTTHAHSDEEIAKHMPEFNDDFVKTIGNFTDVADFKVKAKENILKQKENQATEKKRAEILEKILAETDFKVPQPLIDSELGRMFSQFEADIKNVGLTLEGYLKHINKTPEDLAKEWKNDAEKRAKVNVILSEIAKQEKITADKELVDKEVEFVTKHYKDVDPIRVRLYVEHNFVMEKTIKFLEEQR